MAYLLLLYMKLLGRPFFTINRFGKTFVSDERGIIEANNEDEWNLFQAYGFTPMFKETITIVKLEQKEEKETKENEPKQEEKTKTVYPITNTR